MTDGGLRPLFRQKIPGFFWTTVETGLVTSGIPDMHYLTPTGVSGWVEAKMTHGWAVALRPAQVGWILRYTRMGGRAWVAVRRMSIKGVRRAEADELWLVPGRCAAMLKAEGLQAVVAHVWEGGPGKWDWGMVGEVLMKHPPAVR